MNVAAGREKELKKLKKEFAAELQLTKNRDGRLAITRKKFEESRDKTGDGFPLLDHNAISIAHHTANNGRACQLEKAIAAIEEKDYGMCKECEENIPVERLRAVPAAELCVGCQEKKEAQTGRRVSSKEPLLAALEVDEEEE